MQLPRKDKKKNADADINPNILNNDIIDAWNIGKRVLSQIIQNDFCASQLSTYLANAYEPQLFYIKDVIRWLRNGQREAKKEIVFINGNLGFRCKKNYVNSVTPGSQADIAGVCIGWVVDSINGKIIPCDQNFLETTVGMLSLNAEKIKIVFQLSGICNTIYEPMQDAMLDVMVLSILYDFLESSHWKEIEEPKNQVKFNIRYIALQDVHVYPNDKTVFYLYSTFLRKGEIVSGIKTGNWFKHYLGYSKVINDGKVQLREVKPFSEKHKKLLGKITTLMKADTTKGDWLAQVRTTFQYLPVSISIADANAPDYPLIYINQQFTDVTEYEEKDILGKNCRILQGKDARIKHNIVGRHEIKKSIFHHACACYVRFINSTKSGRRFVNLLAMKPIFNVVTDVAAYIICTHFNVGFSIANYLLTPDVIILKTMDFMGSDYMQSDDMDSISMENDNMSDESEVEIHKDEKFEDKKLGKDKKLKNKNNKKLKDDMVKVGQPSFDAPAPCRKITEFGVIGDERP